MLKEKSPDPLARRSRRRGFGEPQIFERVERVLGTRGTALKPRPRETFEAQARVKFYNSRKGFGFVQLDSGEDAYLGIRAVGERGAQAFRPDIAVKVRCARTQRGIVVDEVLDITDPSRNPVEVTGTVKFFNETKGYGFVAPNDGGNEVFVHLSAVLRSGMDTLRQGAAVAMDVVLSPRGREARSVRPL